MSRLDVFIWPRKNIFGLKRTHFRQILIIIHIDTQKMMLKAKPGVIKSVMLQ